MSARSPYLIGLTGNIATGKSTAAETLSALGAEAIDADQVAHRAMRAGSPVHADIVRLFGPEILTDSGEIDRQRLGDLVFNDPQALARLERVVHPATLEMIERRIARSPADVIVVEAIKLIESGMAAAYDALWVTTCRPEQQIARLVEDRALTQAQAAQRVQAQPAQAEKIARADVVIDTSGSLAETRRQIKTAWRETVTPALR